MLIAADATPGSLREHAARFRSMAAYPMFNEPDYVATLRQLACELERRASELELVTAP